MSDEYEPGLALLSLENVMVKLYWFLKWYATVFDKIDEQ